MSSFYSQISHTNLFTFVQEKLPSLVLSYFLIWIFSSSCSFFFCVILYHTITHFSEHLSRTFLLVHKIKISTRYNVFVQEDSRQYISERWQKRKNSYAKVPECKSSIFLPLTKPPSLFFTLKSTYSGPVKRWTHFKSLHTLITRMTKLERSDLP